MKTEYVPRVNQLDAIQLDNDILRILREQLIKTLQNFAPGLLTRFNPELDLLLRSAIWNFSIRLNSASYGQKLLFICYDRKNLYSNYKLQLHFVLNVLVKYLRDNITFRLMNQRALQRAVESSEMLLLILNLLNFFRFLKDGKRPSLIDYILGLDNITMYGNRRREIGYSHMTRELIWGGFMELLGFTLPLVNYHYLKRKFRSLMYFNLSLGSVEERNMTKPKILLHTKCEYCEERPTLPYYMGCQHVFCFYCLKGNLIADEKFECPACKWNSTIIEPV